MVCFDTTFLIDLMREKRKRKKGPATKKLHELAKRDERPTTTIITLAELYIGPYHVKNTEDELEKIQKIVIGSEAKCLFDFFYFLHRPDQLQEAVSFSPEAQKTIERIKANKP